MLNRSIHCLLLTFLLSACSGGGNTPAPGDDTSPPPIEPDLQTSVPPPTYSGNSAALAYFNGINAMRQQLGLGLLAQNPLLDLASANHANYLKNGYYDEQEWKGGTETPQKSGFTGVTSQDRCNHVGYAGQCLETNRWSERIFHDLPSSYLGLLLLTQGARDIGISMHVTGLFSGEYNGPEIQLGIQSGQSAQKQGTGFLLTAELWRVIHVQINEGETLTVDTFQVWDANNQPIAGKILTHSTDPMNRVPANSAMLVPNKEYWGTPYTCESGVHTLYFAGKRNGVPFTVSRPLDRVYCPFLPPLDLID